MKSKPPTALRPRCSLTGCNQQALMVPDYSKPPVHYYEPSKRRYTEPDGSVTPGGDITSTICYHNVKHESGCCYFHLKSSQELFTRAYPMFGNRTKEEK